MKSCPCSFSGEDNPLLAKSLRGVAVHPTENYDRELQEFFTSGSNSNFTGDDVNTAARVLTGGTTTDYPDEINATTFRNNQHDTTDKLFSAAYSKRVIRGRSLSSCRYHKNGVPANGRHPA